MENVDARRAALRVQMSMTPGPDADALGRRGERRHRHDGVAHEAAVGLPDGVEAARLGTPGELHPRADVVGVLQVQRDREVVVGHLAILALAAGRATVCRGVHAGYRPSMRRTIIGLAVLSLAFAACSDEDRDELEDTADSIAEDDRGGRPDDRHARSRRPSTRRPPMPPSWSPATSPPSRASSSSRTPGSPLDDNGLACEATVTDELDAVDVTCTGTTDDGAAAEMTGTTNELPGASVTELEGQFTGTVDGTEAFTTDTLGG